jgi:hypothetical protein
MRILVHEFKMREVDDIEIFVAEPLSQWLNTDAGKWVKEKSKDTVWMHRFVPDYFEYIVRIYADLSEEDITYYTLKWGSIK